MACGRSSCRQLPSSGSASSAERFIALMTGRSPSSKRTTAAASASASTAALCNTRVRTSSRSSVSARLTSWRARRSSSRVRLSSSSTPRSCSRRAGGLHRLASPRAHGRRRRTSPRRGPRVTDSATTSAIVIGCSALPRTARRPVSGPPSRTSPHSLSPIVSKSASRLIVVRGDGRRLPRARDSTSARRLPELTRRARGRAGTTRGRPSPRPAARRRRRGSGSALATARRPTRSRRPAARPCAVSAARTAGRARESGTAPSGSTSSSAVTSTAPFVVTSAAERAVGQRQQLQRPRRDERESTPPAAEPRRGAVSTHLPHRQRPVEGVVERDLGRRGRLHIAPLRDVLPAELVGDDRARDGQATLRGRVEPTGIAEREPPNRTAMIVRSSASTRDVATGCPGASTSRAKSALSATWVSSVSADSTFTSSFEIVRPSSLQRVAGGSAICPSSREALKPAPAASGPVAQLRVARPQVHARRLRLVGVGTGRVERSPTPADDAADLQLGRNLLRGERLELGEAEPASRSAAGPRGRPCPVRTGSRSRARGDPAGCRP